MPDAKPFSAVRSFRQTFSESVRRNGQLKTVAESIAVVWRYTLEQLIPDRRRARWGDIDFDFDRNIDTTRANVSFTTQLTAALIGTPYFPSQPYLFDEMMRVILGEERAGTAPSYMPSSRAQARSAPQSKDLHLLGEESSAPQQKMSHPLLTLEQLSNLTFIDLGSGKGRSLFLAADYPFRRIIGVELIPELHAIAAKNIAAYNAAAHDNQRCRSIHAICADARDFEFPNDPLFIYLFNPFPESVHERVLANLKRSLDAAPRPVWVAYRLPEYERMLAGSGFLTKVAGTEQWVLYRSDLDQ